MYINSGYLHNCTLGFKDKSRPILVGSCGNYRLMNIPRLPTYRPRGRLDYQIIYVSSGTAHFHFHCEENETIVTAGNMVLYRPKEFQKYEYYGKDKTQVYWLHFTGGNVKNILRKYGIQDDMRVFFVGISSGYEKLFKQMIYELQRCQDHYEEMLDALMHQLLVLIHRDLSMEKQQQDMYWEEEIESAMEYFNLTYGGEIKIEEYARSRGISVSWFIRNFKKYIGSTPMQYIISVRMTNAQILLENTSYSITEIAKIVGYDNPLYFSRLFHKQKGCSPSFYRNQINRHN